MKPVKEKNGVRLCEGVCEDPTSRRCPTCGRWICEQCANGDRCFKCDADTRFGLQPLTAITQMESAELMVLEEFSKTKTYMHIAEKYHDQRKIEWKYSFNKSQRLLTLQILQKGKLVEKFSWKIGVTFQNTEFIVDRSNVTDPHWKRASDDQLERCPHCKRHYVVVMINKVPIHILSDSRIHSSFNGKCSVTKD